MKTFGKFFTVVAVLGSLSAQAIIRSGWERPIQKAKLARLGGSVQYPRAYEVTLHQRDLAKEPTMISLKEDTGIRCVMAPCPSSKTSNFRITQIIRKPHGATVYNAREMVFPAPNVRMATRTLQLTDYEHDVLSDVSHQWLVNVFGPFSSMRSNYGGNPEPVYTIQ